MGLGLNSILQGKISCINFVSCSSAKQANTLVETNGEKQISPITLPVHLDFKPDPPHDSVVKWVNTYMAHLGDSSNSLWHSFHIRWTQQQDNLNCFKKNKLLVIKIYQFMKTSVSWSTFCNFFLIQIRTICNVTCIAVDAWAVRSKWLTLSPESGSWSVEFYLIPFYKIAIWERL